MSIHGIIITSFKHLEKKKPDLFWYPKMYKKYLLMMKINFSFQELEIITGF